MSGMEEKLDGVLAGQANIQIQLERLNNTMDILPRNLAKAFSEGQDKKNDDNNDANNNEEVETVNNIPCQG